MKIKKQVAHGGDVQFYAIDNIPKDVEKLTKVQDKILARGETSGHCHILTGKDVTLFRDKNGVVYATVGSDGAFHQHYKEANVKEETFTVNKNISDCDHTKECFIPAGTYVIGIDQQYDPHEGVWKNNID